MRNKIKLKPLALVLASMTLAPSVAYGGEPAFIEPPMVSIPSGDFIMGSEHGREDEKPVRRVSVPAFQMGKYEVTVAEFRKFLKATDYKKSMECGPGFGERWIGGATGDSALDNDIYAKSEFHPVVCVSRLDAINYAKWLSTETGKNYRLPSEAEWEYTVRGGTTTNFFFGDDKDSSNACEFANISDLHAKNMSVKLFNATYTPGLYKIQPCNDKEVTVSTVGIYKPNPFGVHDLIGNVVERLADCYQDSYQNAPLDASAVTSKDCKTHAVRGGSWHWEAFNSSKRNQIGDDFVGALEGFRLALDTNGKTLPSQKGNKTFIKELAKAQAKSKALHVNSPNYPTKPRGLKVSAGKSDQFTLNWTKNAEKFVSGYRIYRQDLLTNTEEVISAEVKEAYFVDTSPLANNARYSVVALNGEWESLASDKVDSGIFITHILPVKIQGEAFSHAVGADVLDSRMEPENDKIFNSLGDKEASYQIQVTNSGKYQVDARIYFTGQKQQFELWLGDKKLASSLLEGEGGWKTVENIAIELPQGTNTLIVKGEKPRFAINWLDVKAVL